MQLKSFLPYPRSVFILFVLLLQACVGKECDTKLNPVLRLAFVRIVNERETAFLVAFKGITGKEGSRIVPLTEDKFDTTKAISGILLPLSQNIDTVQFILQRTASMGSASLTIAYQRKPYFISQACGFEMEYTNISAEADTTGRVDSVVVVQPSVNADINEVNIKIIFKQ
jgi:hypothetical protein